MKKSTVAQVLSKLDESVEAFIAVASTELCNEFESSDQESNTVTEEEYAMHKTMVSYLCNSMLTSKFKKAYDGDKRMIDLQLGSMLKKVEVDSGLQEVLHEDNVYSFSKKRNVDTTSVSAKDLTLELQKLGVSQDDINQATKNATKSKRGNSYYIVDIV